MGCLSRKITANSRMLRDALVWLKKKFPNEEFHYLLIGMILQGQKSFLLTLLFFSDVHPRSKLSDISKIRSMILPATDPFGGTSIIPILFPKC